MSHRIILRALHPGDPVLIFKNLILINYKIVNIKRTKTVKSQNEKKREKNQTFTLSGKDDIHILFFINHLVSNNI